MSSQTVTTSPLHAVANCDRIRLVDKSNPYTLITPVMETKRDISDFFTLSQRKNGRVEITYNFIQNKFNIWALLQDLGFDMMKLNNKIIIYHRAEHRIITLRQLNYAFREFIINSLEEETKVNLPNGVTPSEILDWCHSHRTWKDPIKKGDLDILDNRIRQHDYELKEDDIYNWEDLHQLRMQTFRKYKDGFDAYQERFKFEHLISAIEEWGFQKTTDSIGSYHLNALVYYKQIYKDKYLVFHYLRDVKNAYIVDCSISEYIDEEHIGITRPIDIKPVCFSGFRFERGFYSLVKEYVEYPTKESVYHAWKKCRGMALSSISRVQQIDERHHDSIVNLWEYIARQPIDSYKTLSPR